jgi:hypothetical protein
MIAQTTDSQGLDDGGTISVLVNIGSGGGTVGLKFEWYEPNSFDNGSFTSGSLLTQRFKYTTFDIDFKQLVQVQTSEITSYTLDGSTVLTAPSNGPTITFQDGGADSTVTNPTTAAQFLTIDATASHTITMGKQNSNGNALFMFEFRDPATVAPFNNPNSLGAFLKTMAHRRRK